MLLGYVALGQVIAAAKVTPASAERAPANDQVALICAKSRVGESRASGGNDCVKEGQGQGALCSLAEWTRRVFVRGCK